MPNSSRRASPWRCGVLTAKYRAASTTICGLWDPLRPRSLGIPFLVNFYHHLSFFQQTRVRLISLIFYTTNFHFYLQDGFVAQKSARIAAG